MKLTLEMHGTTYTVEQEHSDQTWPEMLEIFEHLLRQAGYVFDGHFDVTEASE